MSKINKVNFDGAYLRSSSGHFLTLFMTGQVEEWAISGLSWLQDLATDEEEWNRTLGTTPDFFEIPPEQVCLFGWLVVCLFLFVSCSC